MWTVWTQIDREIPVQKCSLSRSARTHKKETNKGTDTSATWLAFKVERVLHSKWNVFCIQAFCVRGVVCCLERDKCKDRMCACAQQTMVCLVVLLSNSVLTEWNGAEL